MSTPINIVVGHPTAIPIQCYLRGTGTVPAVFNADDILSASVRAPGAIADAKNPSVAFYTAGGTQDGFPQGQVEVTFTGAQASQLVPTVPYNLLVYRALSINPTDPEVIVRLPLVVEALA